MYRILMVAWLGMLVACSKQEEFTGSLEFVSPVENSTLGERLTVQLQTAPAAAFIDLSLDGEIVARLSSPYTHELDLRQLADGAHELTAVAFFNVNGERPQLERRVSFTRDATAPKIVARWPQAGEPFTRACGIAAEFSEIIVPDSLSVTVRDGAGASVPASLVLLGGRKLLIFPAVPAALPTSWNISIMATDEFGNVLSEGPWGLEVPRLVEGLRPDSPGSSEMTIARSGSEIVMAYQEAVPGQETPAIAFGSLCKSGPAARVESNTGAVALATAPDGIAYAAHHGIHVHRLVNDVWGDPIATMPFSTWTWNVGLAIGPGGMMALGWQPAQEYRCQHAGRVVNGTLEELTGMPCGPESGLTTEPQVVVDGAGRPVFAWLERTAAGTASVRVVAWSPEGWVQLGESFPGIGYERPMLSVDAQGRPVVAYSSPANDGILVKVWTGTDWSDLPRLAAENWAFPKKLAVSGSTLFLAWEQPRAGGDFELRVSALGSGDTAWRTEAGPFDIIGPSHWGSVGLVTDQAGWSVLAWTNPASDGRYRIHTAWNNVSTR
ncbi:Ig-like domain-containing protein [Hyalangium minutum]|uniref:SbsA Ig-like domain-containing protein n=1 Tax=Hyalangium minutum TaxID=394096 RepID=A0A085VU21_9BACT|nr:Ig-like domain-containing protein [Hyalangium minutum]KFE58934.1 hypothetical protein DB31_6231 [Hyalangium minutum]